MADIGHQLRIRFGLERDPTPTQQSEWARLTRTLVQQGMTLDAAGREAARRLFPDYDRMIYRSEADTIEMLLRKAEQ